jgi:aldoxime dehydratase
LESAIPQHLICPRSRQRRIPDDFVPAFPAAIARFEPAVKQVVMAYFGIQYKGPEVPAAVTEALRKIGAVFRSDSRPGHWDRATYEDEAGFTNVVSIGYWDDPAAFDVWFGRHGADWANGAIAGDRIGTFTEVLRPSVERFETLFSSDVPEGVAVVARGLSGPIQEHAYWGGMRDRLPRSQTDEMAPTGEPRVQTEGVHRRVFAHDHACLIRSGQDWTQTDAEERRMYVQDVEPVLRAGMQFLRDEGLSVGCYANRYMTVVDAEGKPVEKSFGMSWWRSLSALERWAESHPTHVAIFGAAMKYLGTLGPAAKLKLYHEVSVVSASEQYFEYFNCHPRTGMLRVAP